MTLLPTTWQPTPENILDVADHAVRTVLRMRLHTTEDIQDATQAAAVEVWDALQRHGNRGRGYSFQVARYAVIDWLDARCNRVPECHLEPLEYHLSQSETADDAPAFTTEHIRALPQITDKEATYLAYRLQGHSPAGVALRMGVHLTTAEKYRRSARIKLEHLAERPALQLQLI